MNAKVAAWLDRVPADDWSFVLGYLLSEIARTGTATSATVEGALRNVLDLR